ncbi:MAG: hypothetical protein Ct9H300mP21_03510 [Pseudomonadota bacterium]|nr:MAG: hypothetical protein Ct9H300mP21_03510 [Pseudomonadota bacterium]
MMDLPACGRATVESVSENLNDGVMALYSFFVFLEYRECCYLKLSAHLGSMVGYQNKRYQDFGWCSAKFDDLLSLGSCKDQFGFSCLELQLFSRNFPAGMLSKLVGRIMQNFPALMPAGVRPL